MTTIEAFTYLSLHFSRPWLSRSIHRVWKCYWTLFRLLTGRKTRIQFAESVNPDGTHLQEACTWCIQQPGMVGGKGTGTVTPSDFYHPFPSILSLSHTIHVHFVPAFLWHQAKDKWKSSMPLKMLSKVKLAEFYPLNKVNLFTCINTTTLLHTWAEIQLYNTRLLDLGRFTSQTSKTATETVQDWWQCH